MALSTDYVLAGSRLRELRLSKRMSTDTLARGTGISTAYLSQLETGKRMRVSVAVLDGLERTLGVNGLNHFASLEELSIRDASVPA